MKKLLIITALIGATGLTVILCPKAPTDTPVPAAKTDGPEYFKNKISAFSQRSYEDLSETEKKRLIEFNRAKVVLLKKRMDQRLRRLML